MITSFSFIQSIRKPSMKILNPSRMSKLKYQDLKLTKKRTQIIYFLSLFTFSPLHTKIMKNSNNKEMLSKEQS